MIKDSFFVKGDALASFLPLHLGEQIISNLAPVKRGRRPSPKVTRSALDGHSERGITDKLICEQSERGVLFEKKAEEMEKKFAASSD